MAVELLPENAVDGAGGEDAVGEEVDEGVEPEEGVEDCYNGSLGKSHGGGRWWVNGRVMLHGA